MSDAELRTRARAVETTPGDEAAARAYLSQAEQLGDEATIVRALGFCARQGSVTAHERLVRLPSRPLLDIRVEKDGIALNNTRGSWSGFDMDSATLPWTGSLGVTKATIDQRQYRMSIEGDHLLVLPTEGGALLLDLGVPGRFAWDTRPRAAASIDYSPSRTFEVGERVRHAKFGEGIVARIPDRRKVVITFESGDRSLAQGMGGAAPPAASFTRVGTECRLVASLALVEWWEKIGPAASAPRVTALDAIEGRVRFELGEVKLGACRADARGIVACDWLGRDRGDTERGRMAEWRRDESKSVRELDPRTGEARWSVPGRWRAVVALGERVAVVEREVRPHGNDDVDTELVAFDRATRGAVLARSGLNEQGRREGNVFVIRGSTSVNLETGSVIHGDA